jgi:hypothetical protein
VEPVLETVLRLWVVLGPEVDDRVADASIEWHTVVDLPLRERMSPAKPVPAVDLGAQAVADVAVATRPARRTDRVDISRLDSPGRALCIGQLAVRLAHKPQRLLRLVTASSRERISPPSSQGERRSGPECPRREVVRSASSDHYPRTSSASSGHLDWPPDPGEDNGLPANAGNLLPWSIASHARGRWFETSRAHPESPCYHAHFVPADRRSMCLSQRPNGVSGQYPCDSATVRTCFTSDQTGPT